MSTFGSRFDLVIVLCLLAAAPAAGAVDFHPDLRNGRLDQEIFQLTGNDAGHHIHAEPDGLRIKMTGQHGKQAALGIIPRIDIHGDFEVTVSYELLQVSQPTTGYGAGVNIWLVTKTPTREAAAISRVLSPQGEHCYTTSRMTTKADGKRAFRGGQPRSTQTMSGRLRLVRQGKMIYYLFADGSEASFEEAYQDELGDEDIETLRIAVDGGDAAASVEVRLAAVTVGPPTARGLWAVLTRRPVYLSAGLTALAAAAGAVWLWRRQHAAQPAGGKPGSKLKSPGVAKNGL